VIDWGLGCYELTAVQLEPVAEDLVARAVLHEGERVLDVGCGTGNAALLATYEGARVTGVDAAARLIRTAQRRADVDGVKDVATFVVGDAQALPFDDASFDAVLSTFGVMFAPDQPKCAAEMMRVCRRGGRIGMANWTPQGFIGQMFKTLGAYVPPPPGVSPPSKWGVEEHLHTLFDPHGATIAVTPRKFRFRYRSPAHFIDVFRQWYGPVHKAFAALPPDRADGLARDLTDLMNSLNTAGKDSLVIPSEYLEVVVTKR